LGTGFTFKSFEILVPVGLSYFTFKKISYLIDVYRETIPPEKRLLGFALYVSFFPSIMAGPIDRAGYLIPQFYSEKYNKSHFDYQQVTDGLKLMAWGFFKKVMIADQLAMFVNKVYSDPSQFHGPGLLVATLYFSIQIYCDFSGYTDIALGAGKVLGIELTENFNRPYFSRSVGEFWKRWHISLSTWLMDYIFLPVAYSVSRAIKSPRLMKVKAETWSYISGILITMILCGFWHGANWTFVIWGGLHGLFLAVSFATRRKRKRLVKRFNLKKYPWLYGGFQVLTTFSLVTFGWIFFRAESVSDAFYIVTHLFSGWESIFNASGLMQSLHFGLLKRPLAIAGISALVLITVHIARKDRTLEEWIKARKPVLRWCFYLGLLLWLLAFSDTASGDFIYFRF
jgi:D-alanyl-lipoteichoic acid acyltransferase DltB (MBOAT superfamily)